MIQHENQFVNPGSLQSNLYVLKHKDLDVAMVQVDNFTGKIEYVLEVYLPDELPVGCGKNAGELMTWWESRAIPDSRKGIPSSVTGEMKKKWIIRDGIRYLMKVNANDYGQQSVNEIIACRLHERLEWKNYVPYEIEHAIVEGIEVPCSINPLFTSLSLEFVAYQLIRNCKVRKDTSVYETAISQAGLLGLNETEVRRQLEYTILTDFILTNTDRHFNNFGFLYDSTRHELIGMAPVFDTGNALFYNQEIIPTGKNLLDVHVSSFSDKEVRLLRYVTDKELVNPEKLDGFWLEAETLLKKHTKMPSKRAENIAGTICQKIELLRLFQQGKKIWKAEKYW